MLPRLHHHQCLQPLDLHAVLSFGEALLVFDSGEKGGKKKRPNVCFILTAALIGAYTSVLYVYAGYIQLCMDVFLTIPTLFTSHV